MIVLVVMTKETNVSLICVAYRYNKNQRCQVLNKISLSRFMV